MPGPPFCSAHAFIYDFAGLRGQGYFAVFDGHAGKKAAEYCGLHFHEVRSKSLYWYQRGHRFASVEN
jgi:serine/threonine protein phosphatase PrpC